MYSISLCAVQDTLLLRVSLKVIGRRTRLASKVSLKRKRTSHVLVNPISYFNEVYKIIYFASHGDFAFGFE